MITIIYIFSAGLPKQLIFTAAGTFLLSAFIDWFLPVRYLYRFIMILLFEYLLIVLFGRQSISLLQTALLVVMVNTIGFGMIIVTYLLFVFW